jgi:endonuclease/exonuclease/phosphatase family metal-dependent hydrolase
MTWNIHHGEGTDGRLDLERIARRIREAQPDLVALQEVDRGVARTQGRDLPAELAALTGLSPAFHRNIEYQGGEYGNATLSRWPILSVTNHHYAMLREGEQRGLLEVVVKIGGRQLAFWNTHIDHRPDDAERVSNVREIRQFLMDSPHDVVLAGDFNDLPDSRVHRGLREVFKDAWIEAGQGAGATFPGRSPRRIDYIWIDQDAPIEVTTVRVIESDASDHWAVVAELRYRAGD